MLAPRTTLMILLPVSLSDPVKELGTLASLLREERGGFSVIGSNPHPPPACDRNFELHASSEMSGTSEHY